MQQTVYIRSTANISPQKSFGEAYFLSEPVEYTGSRLTCIEPDYSTLIDPKLIRRMSRIIKMGVAAASACLITSGRALPDAILTGTAYGCLEDTEVFLKKMIENKEEMLSPTSFIQSTHNTVGAQIALLLKCHQYNNTFVHKGFSFESALLDALLLLQENNVSYVLVGGLDEITSSSHAILHRMGLYKRLPVSNLDLFETTSKGTIAGEGAAFFVLTNQASAQNESVLNFVHTFYKPAGIAEIENNIHSILKQEAINIKEIDLVIAGRNGDQREDEIYKALHKSVFKGTRLIPFKHLCGEYPTATAFSLWLANGIIKQNSIPNWMETSYSGKRDTKRILIYNHYKNRYHSLFLLSAC